MIKYENLNFNFLFSTLKLYIKSNFKIKKIYYMKITIFIYLTSLFLSSSTFSFTNKDLTGKQLLCPKLLWGFEFISSNKVKVIETNLNKETIITQYNYNTDIDLSFINIFENEGKIRDRVYSIEINSLRVDIWTMTGGGFTTREMFPRGFCEFVKNGDIFSQIENLKLYN